MNRLALGLGVRLAARWLRRSACRLERLARERQAADWQLAMAHRDKADHFRQAASELEAAAFRKRLYPERRRVPRALTEPGGPLRQLAETALDVEIDARVFGVRRG